MGKRRNAGIDEEQIMEYGYENLKATVKLIYGQFKQEARDIASLFKQLIT